MGLIEDLTELIRGNVWVVVHVLRDLKIALPRDSKILPREFLNREVLVLKKGDIITLPITITIPLLRRGLVEEIETNEYGLRVVSHDMGKSQQEDMANVEG